METDTVNDNKIKKNAVEGLVWKWAERCGAQGVTLLVSIVLARLLTPDEYGTVALVTVFITVLQVFIDSGLGNALIQKKESDDIDFSTVFYFNSVLCVVLYTGLYFGAPFIAEFYERAELTTIVRVLGITLIISALKNIQQAYVSKHMQFKKFFIATLIGTVLSAFIGIGLAYNGAGVWAIVGQTLSNNLVGTICLWAIVKWRPKRLFSLERLKSLFSYGWKLLCSSLVDSIYNNLRQLLIGKFYSPSSLALYNRGEQFPHLIISNINSSIDSVMFPAMSKLQDNVEDVKRLTRRAIKTSSYVIWPMMIGLAVCAEGIVTVVFTEKWIESVPFLQILCISYALWPIHTANLNAIKALGRSDLFLKLEIIKKCMGLLFLAISIPYGVKAMVVFYCINSYISLFINAHPNNKLLNYKYMEQIKDMLPGMLMSLVMGIIIWPIAFLSIPTIVILILQVLAGAGIYVLLSILFKVDSYFYLYGLLKQYIKKRK